MSNDDDKRSNYGLMNALRRTKAIFADFSKISKVTNDIRKTRYDFPIDFSPICVAITVKFPIPKKNIESFSTFFSFLDRSSCMKS